MMCACCLSVLAICQRARRIVREHSEEAGTRTAANLHERDTRDYLSSHPSFRPCKEAAAASFKEAAAASFVCRWAS